MASLPHIGDSLAGELPLAELTAAVLDGEAARLGPTFTPVDVPPGVTSRARALKHVLPRRFIADRRTAAWVYGALFALPEPLDACVRTRDRPKMCVGLDARLRQVVINESEIALISGVSVTTPLRTMFDLLREPDFGDDAAALVRRISRLRDVSFGDCARYLDSRSHLPKKALTRARLETAFERRVPA